MEVAEEMELEELRAMQLARWEAATQVEQRGSGVMCGELDEQGVDVLERRHAGRDPATS